jgi:hypothetical protein
MPGIVQPLLVLAGVVIGALASYLTTSATERARWQRQQATRWDEKRAQVYAEYGYAVKNVYIACLRISESRRLSTTGGSPYSTLTLDHLDALAAERTAKWESVLLLGNPETIAAARIWHRTIWRMQDMARGTTSFEGAAWAALIEEIEDARARFYEAARDDLGISSGLIPRAGRWGWENPSSLDIGQDSPQGP